MLTSVELQKYPKSRYYYHESRTMLFDVDATDEVVESHLTVKPAEDATAMAAVPGDIIQELTIA